MKRREEKREGRSVNKEGRRGEEARRGEIEGRRAGMTENSLHKCEHHACTHTHTNTHTVIHNTGIVLCPEFDSNFLKRPAVGRKLPQRRCIIHSKDSPKVCCIKRTTSTTAAFERRAPITGGRAAEVSQFASQTALRPQLEAGRLNIKTSSRNEERLLWRGRGSVQRCLP